MAATISSYHVESEFRALQAASPAEDACAQQMQAVVDALREMEAVNAELRAAVTAENAQHTDKLAARGDWEEAVLNLRLAAAELRAAEAVARAAAATVRVDDAEVAAADRDLSRLRHMENAAKNSLAACKGDPDCIARWNEQLISLETEAADAAIARGKAEAQRAADEAELDKATASLKQAQPACDAARQADSAATNRFRATVAREHEAHARSVEARRNLRAARRRLTEALDALQECRKHHPAHYCGERGGPGIRTHRGKCMSWSEFRRAARGGDDAG